MSWIALVMLGLIAASLVLEKVLPMRIKEVAGRGICWGLMAITMTFLSLSTVGLLWVLVVQQVLPSLR